MTKEQLEQLDDQGMAAWDAHDADAFLAVLADDFVWNDWTLTEPITTRGAARDHFNSWITAFPDMAVKVTNRVVGDDAVAAEVSWSGTNTGPMSMGGIEIPPTGKAAQGRGAYLARVRDGKVVEFNTYPDAAGMMMQLGLLPEM